MSNKKGGKKYKRSAKNKDTEHIFYTKQDAEKEYKGAILNYGLVTKAFGCGVLDVEIFIKEGSKWIKKAPIKCYIRGALYKKIWIGIGDIVLVNIRDYQTNKGDILCRYTEEQVKKLRTINEIPAKLEEEHEADDDDVQFEEI